MRHLNSQPQFIHKKRLSDKGIITLSTISTFFSLFLVNHIHSELYASRLADNANYHGQFGGEICIPLLIVFVTVYILSRREQMRYVKYEKI